MCRTHIIELQKLQSKIPVKQSYWQPVSQSLTNCLLKSINNWLCWLHYHQMATVNRIHSPVQWLVKPPNSFNLASFSGFLIFFWSFQLQTLEQNGYCLSVNLLLAKFCQKKLWIIIIWIRLCIIMNNDEQHNLLTRHQTEAQWSNYLFWK